MKRLAILLAAATLALGPTTTKPAHADDKEIPMDQLPPSTRETIAREAQGGKVDKVDKLSDDGRLYKADIKIGDTKEQLYVDATGKVVGKHAEKK
ncbi:MAG TPA: hypothetical protein VJT73_14845 [Polyangiaceae bacterium]|nr:hypothetical protein [Polyangiaceae bacterium]